MARESWGRGLCAALACVLIGCATTSSSSSSSSAAASSLPDFELSAVSGQTVRLSEHLGRDVVLLAFWATWCEPCKAELPHLDRLYRAHKEDGFTVLAISMDDPATIMQVAPYAHEAGFDFPVLLDPNGLATNLYNTHRSAPYTVMISRDGKIASESPGFEVASIKAPGRSDQRAARRKTEMTGRPRGLAAVVVLLGFAARGQPVETPPPEVVRVASEPAADAGLADALLTVPDAGIFELIAEKPPSLPVPEKPAEIPARVQLSNSARFAYHLDNGNIAPRGTVLYDPTGNNYVDWLNRLQLDAWWGAGRFGNLSAQLRVDSALFLNEPFASPNDVRLTQLLINRYSDRFDFEKVWLRWSNRYFELTLGDSYATFGRGLVLSVRKIDEFGVDTTVRGLSATARVGGLFVHALGGWTNIVNVDPMSGRSAENPNDVIVGAHAEYRVKTWVVPSFNVSHVIYATSLVGAVQDARDTVTSFSGAIELPSIFGFGNLYAEVAAQRRVTGGVELWTTAMYATASAFIGPVTLLLEAKDYRNYSNVPTSLDPTQVPELTLNNFYTAAPTLERVNQIVLNNTDVSGGHLRASLKLTEAIVPFVSMAVFSDRIYHTVIYDPYAGAELRWNEGRSHASFFGGLRFNQYAEGSVAPGALFQRVWHGSLDITQQITGPWAIELKALNFSNRDARGPYYFDWHQGQAYLGVRHERWSAAVGYEYYTEAPETIRPHYFNIGGSWKVLPNLQVRAFIGGERAGIKCINGVCRNYPGFNGARLEVVAKY